MWNETSALPGDARQPRGIVGDQRRVVAQHRSQFGDAGRAALHAALVEVVAQEVDAVGAGEVVAGIAVEVGDLHARRLGDEGARRQCSPDARAELEGHAIALGELQVGDVRGGLGGALERALRPGAERARQPLEAGAAPRGDLLARIVGAEEGGIVVGVVRHQPGQGAGHAGVARQRAVLGARQGEPRAELRPEQGHHDHQACQREGRGRLDLEQSCHHRSLASPVAP